MKKNKGFSLLELLLVMALVGLLSSFIVPTFSNSMSKIRLKAAAKKTTAIIRYTRNQAIARKKPYWMIFDKKEGRVAITDKVLTSQDEDDNDNSKEAFDSLSPSAKVYSYPDEIRIERLLVGEEEVSDDQSVLIFYPNGSCSGGEIVLQADKLRSYHITLDPIISTATITLNENETS